MTQFALTRSWRSAPARELVVSAVDGGPVVAIPTIDPSKPLVVWVDGIAACVVIGGPSGAGRLGIRALRSDHGVFEPVLPDGTALERAPVIADLTTGGRATLALVMEPPQRVTVSDGARRRVPLADVVLCSPEEPDAVARALALLGVRVDTDPHAVASRHFGVAAGSESQRPSRPGPFARYVPWMIMPAVFAAVVASRSVPWLASALGAVALGAIVIDVVLRRRNRA